MKTRRAGEPAAPTPLRAHRAVEPSPRETRPPERIACIRGLAAVVEEHRQTEAAWLEVWADQVVKRHP